MNKNDFKEVMHIVACSEECERYYEELNSIRKRRKNLKTGIVCTASIIAVITVAFTTILLSRSFKKEPDNRNSEKILISTSTTDPTSEQTEPSQMTTPAATVERSIIGEELIISPDSSKPTTADFMMNSFIFSMAGAAFFLASLTQFTNEPWLISRPNTSLKKLSIRP